MDNSEIEILVAEPKFLGGSYPSFNEKKVNEKKFEHELRAKEYYIMLYPNENRGYVEWLSQDSNHFSEKLENEIIRAFKANGAKPGTKIEIKFGIRDYGLNQTFDVVVH